MPKLIAGCYLLVTLFSTSAFAEPQQADAWIEMSDLCETTVFEQTEAAFDKFAPARPLINIQGLRELAVAHASSSLIASAVNDGSEWFMCIVASRPELKVKNAGAVIETWTKTQLRRTKEPGNEAVVFDDQDTFAPVRVRCGDMDHIAVVMAFEIDDEFRVGVTSRLPPSVANPCRLER